MANVKTAISVSDKLFEQADEIASEMNVSRSRLFSLALEEFVLRYQNRKLLKQINEAYSDSDDIEEQERRLATLSPEDWRRPFDEFEAIAAQEQPEEDINSISDEELVALVHQARQEKP